MKAWVHAIRAALLKEQDSHVDNREIDTGKGLTLQLQDRSLYAAPHLRDALD